MASLNTLGFTTKLELSSVSQSLFNLNMFLVFEPTEMDCDDHQLWSWGEEGFLAFGHAHAGHGSSSGK